MDYPLLGAMVVFFCLSFILAWVIDKLPVWCQSSWFIISVWGITWVNVGYGIIHPEAWPHIYKLALIFYAALPGMMYLDHLQKKSRVSYWEKTGNIPQRRIVYLSELLDRLAFWWTCRRIECDNDDLENNVLPQPHSRNNHSDNSSRSIHPG